MFFLCFCVLSTGFAASKLQMEDVPRVMKQLMHYHVENKNITPFLVKRSFRIYIEQFDAEKLYFYEEEITPYLNMSEEMALQIAEKIKKGDFSDFQVLDRLVQKSIIRARNFRQKKGEEYIKAEGEKGGLVLSPYFAKTKQEWEGKNWGKMAWFFRGHTRKTNIDSKEKRQKLVQLYERKVAKQEKLYLNTEDKRALRILKAFAKSLDAHTSFFSKEEATELRTGLEKQFEGIGVVLSEGIEGLVITAVVPKGPADNSKQIEAEDILLEVNGKSVERFGFDTVLQEMNQAKGSLSLKIKKARGSKVISLVLEKKPIVMEQDRLSYSYEPCEGGILAKIVLPSFYESSSGITSEKDLKNALRALEKIAPIKGLVLDFRDNPGGFLSQAVKVAGVFISSGVVAISKYGKNEIHYLRKLDTHAFYSGPLVILTSKLSASAAEIVAQSLQDYGAAIIVGDRTTYGKGSIQYQTITDKNADYFFKVTVGRYYTVSGRSTQIEGVIADIVVPSAFAPFNIGERYLEYPLSADHLQAAYSDNLNDLEERHKRWFQNNYLPFLQKRITTWQKMLPLLKERSQKRLQEDPQFQAFLEKQKQIKEKLETKKGVSFDPSSIFPKEDLQMKEALYILKDMMDLQGKKGAVKGFSYTLFEAA